MTTTATPFFLEIRDEATVWCSEHDAPVDTWTPGPPFADRAEAEAFIAATRDWYEGAAGHGPDHCLFRHPAPSVPLKEAAAILGISPDNLRQAIARGSLAATKHGRDWWVEPAEVERYGRENRRPR